MNNQWNDKIFRVNASNFQQLCLDIFHFQYQANRTYRNYVDLLKIKPDKVNGLAEIPFMPIQFFKTHIVKATDFSPDCIFESSGTSQSIHSHHHIKDVTLYRQSFLKAFELFYGHVSEWCIIALLPSYLVRKNSSLVFMVGELISRSDHAKSGFYLNEHEKLYRALTELEAEGQKTILIGVSFALLDFAEKYSLPLKQTVVMETGGMKGRRDEMVRQELHNFLQEKFDVQCIHSEYGMTELLSQAYSKNAGVFHSPPWMKVLIRDEQDPLSVRSECDSREFVVSSLEQGTHTSDAAANSSLTARQHQDHHSITGAINIIDLANVYSCSFIATDDAGKLYADGTFEVLGRLDNSDIRGCSLMMI
jgi:Acyl-protein synthetase, LuxE